MRSRLVRCRDAQARCVTCAAAWVITRRQPRPTPPLKNCLTHMHCTFAYLLLAAGLLNESSQRLKEGQRRNSWSSWQRKLRELWCPSDSPPEWWVLSVQTTRALGERLYGSSRSKLWVKAAVHSRDTTTMPAREAATSRCGCA